MSVPNPADERAGISRALRADMVIAICALVISSLATAASWWQSHVVAEQLSAQVWPYVSFTTSFTPESVTIAIANEGLGPAVLRTAALSVDGKPQRGFVDALHAVLGPNLGERAKRAHQTLNLNLASSGPGAVLRVGTSATVFAFTSKMFASRLARAAPRLTLRVCYCSIEGTCWTKESRSDEPAPVSQCRPEPFDLLRSTTDMNVMLSGNAARSL